MTDNGKARWNASGERIGPRVHSLREITISYEGQDENIIVKPPNVSVRGMFINTSRAFPEGAVLNVRFALALTNGEIQTRCEVRHCQPGVGVGVEFIDLGADAKRLIEREIELNHGNLKRGNPRARLRRQQPRTRKKRSG
jgi:PilZ domain-containing protein